MENTTTLKPINTSFFISTDGMALIPRQNNTVFAALDTTQGTSTDLVGQVYKPTTVATPIQYNSSHNMLSTFLSMGFFWITLSFMVAAGLAMFTYNRSHIRYI